MYTHTHTHTHAHTPHPRNPPTHTYTPPHARTRMYTHTHILGASLFLCLIKIKPTWLHAEKLRFVAWKSTSFVQIVIGPTKHLNTYTDTIICTVFTFSAQLASSFRFPFNWTFILSAYWTRLFYRLKIGRFSGSLAELFLAPPIAALSVESRSVPAVVSTSRLLLIFNLWAAECTRCFLYFNWVFPVVKYWCCDACLLFFNVALFCTFYVCTVHIFIVCMKGPLAKMVYCLHPLWVFFWELGLILNECFL